MNALTRRNILISGLTAAGKTTHARLLAAHLGYEYVSASRRLSQLSGVTGPAWSPTVDRQRAHNAHLDKRVDEELVRLDADRSGLVIDSWALPWLTTTKSLRLWLASDLPSRIRKADVSYQLRQQPTPTSTVADIVTTKDEFSREQFWNLYKIDLGNLSDFHIILDNSTTIPEATPASAQAGIAQFQPIVETAVATALNRGCGSEK